MNLEEDYPLRDMSDWLMGCLACLVVLLTVARPRWQEMHECTTRFQGYGTAYTNCPSGELALAVVAIVCAVGLAVSAYCAAKAFGRHRAQQRALPPKHKRYSSYCR